MGDEIEEVIMVCPIIRNFPHGIAQSHIRK